MERAGLIGGEGVIAQRLKREDIILDMARDITGFGEALQEINYWKFSQACKVINSYCLRFRRLE